MPVVEVFREAWQEVLLHPSVFVAELAQFAILLAILKAVILGWGERKGLVVNMLAERLERVREEVETAEARRAAFSRLEERVASIHAEAESEAQAIMARASEDAARERELVGEQIREEIARIERQTDETLEREREEAIRGVHEQFLPIITSSIRKLVDEGFSPDERKKRLEHAILQSVSELESVALE